MRFVALLIAILCLLSLVFSTVVIDSDSFDEGSPVTFSFTNDKEWDVGHTISFDITAEQFDENSPLCGAMPEQDNHTCHFWPIFINAPTLWNSPLNDNPGQCWVNDDIKNIIGSISIDEPSNTDSNFPTPDMLSEFTITFAASTLINENSKISCQVQSISGSHVSTILFDGSKISINKNVSTKIELSPIDKGHIFPILQLNITLHNALSYGVYPLSLGAITTSVVGDTKVIEYAAMDYVDGLWNSVPQSWVCTDSKARIYDQVHGNYNKMIFITSTNNDHEHTHKIPIQCTLTMHLYEIIPFILWQDYRDEINKRMPIDNPDIIPSTQTDVDIHFRIGSHTQTKIPINYWKINSDNIYEDMFYSNQSILDCSTTFDQVKSDILHIECENKSMTLRAEEIVLFDNNTIEHHPITNMTDITRNISNVEGGSIDTATGILKFDITEWQLGYHQVISFDIKLAEHLHHKYISINGRIQGSVFDIASPEPKIVREYNGVSSIVTIVPTVNFKGELTINTGLSHQLTAVITTTDAYLSSTDGIHISINPYGSLPLSLLHNVLSTQSSSSSSEAFKNNIKCSINSSDDNNDKGQSINMTYNEQFGYPTWNAYIENVFIDKTYKLTIICDTTLSYPLSYNLHTRSIKPYIRLFEREYWPELDVIIKHDTVDQTLYIPIAQWDTTQYLYPTSSLIIQQYYTRIHDTIKDNTEDDTITQCKTLLLSLKEDDIIIVPFGQIENETVYNPIPGYSRSSGLQSVWAVSMLIKKDVTIYDNITQQCIDLFPELKFYKNTSPSKDHSTWYPLNIDTIAPQMQHSKIGEQCTYSYECQNGSISSCIGHKCTLLLSPLDTGNILNVPDILTSISYNTAHSIYYIPIFVYMLIIGTIISILI